MQSKYAGTCKVSGERYEVGAEIEKFQGNWVLSEYASEDKIATWFRQMADEAKALLSPDAANRKGMTYHNLIDEKTAAQIERLYSAPVYIQTIQSSVSEMQNMIDAMKRIAANR
jgi:hypothetical protein